MLFSIPLKLRRFRSSLLLFLAVSAQAQFDFDILDELYPEDFFQPPTMSQLTLSPSGKQYIYTFSNNEKNTFYVIDIETDEKRVFAGERITQDRISYIAWKGEQQVIFQSQHGNVYHLDLKSGKRSLLFDASRSVYFYNAIFWGNFTLPRVISLLPNDPKHILISAFDSNANRIVYKIPLKGGYTDKLKPFIKSEKGINSWHADPNGVVRLGIRGDSNEVVFFTRQGNSNRWIPINKLFDSDSQVEIGLSKSNFMGRRDYFAGFGFDPNTLYIASNKQSNTTTLYKYDISGKSDPIPIANDPEYDFFDLSDSFASIRSSSKRKKLVGIPYYRDIATVYWLDEHFKNIQAKIDRQLPESSNLILSWNEDETRFIAATLRTDKPFEYYLYDLETDQTEALGGQNESLKNKTLAKTQSIQFESRDGLELYGYLTLAKSESDKPAPLVMLPHGGPWARDLGGYDPTIQWLAYNGYSVLQVNFRGSTGYGYEHYIASRQDFGWGIQKDIDDALAWAISNNHASEDNIAIMGLSYGGYATMLALATQPGKYKCGVAMSGIYDLLKTSKNLKAAGQSGIAFEHFREMVGREWKDRNTLRSISPVFLADQVEEPVLLVHGKMDQVASFEQSADMLKALEKAGKSANLITIEDEGHGFFIPRNQISAFGSAVEFLDKHLSKD